jgi:cytochrome b561
MKASTMTILALKNDAPDRAGSYGTVAILFHWAAAALVVLLGITGLLLEDIPRQSQAFWINIHGTVGLIYLAVVVARLAWRAGHPPPELPSDIGEFSRRVSCTVHVLLYALMLAIPLLGIVAFVWHGRAFDYGLFRIDFGIASNRAVFHPAEDIHGSLVYALFALAGLHALAALWHRFVRKDGVLSRILLGRESIRDRC